MARINGQEVSFEGRSMPEICNAILDASPTKDGRGIRLTLTTLEIIAFDVAAHGMQASGLRGMSALGDLLKTLLAERSPQASEGFTFKGNLSKGTFVT